MMWFEPRTNALIYSTHESLKIVQAIPDARHLAAGQVVVPATLENLQRLRRIDFPIIDPLRNYDWPGRYKPFKAQRVTSNFLAANPRAFVLSDMGTGKTLAALWAADYIMQQYPKGECRCLVVAPLSILRRVWADAIFQNFLGRRTSVVLHGTEKQRLDTLTCDADFYLVNHDGLGVGASSDRRIGLTGFSAAVFARRDIRVSIVDEGSAYKDAQTKRSRVARGILQSRDYLWLMTGTPTPNAPTDAYGLAKLVNGAHDMSYRAFQALTMTQVSQFKWVPRAGAQQEVRKLLYPAVRFAIEDCVDLPPCTVQAREAEMSPEQNKAYQKLKRELILLTSNGQTVTAANEGVLRMKLIQIACGAVYDQNHVAHNLNPVNRLAVLEEAIEQASHKIIIFAPLTSVINLLNVKLAKYSRRVVNGAVSVKERSEIFRQFQDEEDPRILIADPATMAHGLTLTEAATVIWFCPVDKTELYIQANARINRPGQKNRTTIVQISAAKVEREIYRRLEANESLQGVMLRLVEEK